MSNQVLNREKIEACIKEAAEWFAKRRHYMTPKDLRPIAMKYFTGDELTEFYNYLTTDEGKAEFKKQLRFQAVKLGLYKGG